MSEASKEVGFWPVALLALYTLGALLAALRPLLGLRGIGHLRRICVPVTDAPTLALSADCAAVLCLSRPVLLCVADVPVPMTWGWRRPVVLLPLEYFDWPADRTQAVLLHEMAHVKRRDWLSHRLADLVCAVYWFHPLVWLTTRRLRAEGEIACDDLVLASGIAAPDYARHLLDIARAFSSPSQPPQSAIAMAQTSQIAGRLTMILDKTQSRRILTRRVLLTTLGLGTIALVVLAVLKPTAKAQVTPDFSANEQNATITAQFNQKKQLRLSQAGELREHLSVWAQANKALLVQMQNASPDNLTALIRVYASLDKQPFPLWSGDPRVGAPMPAFSTQTTGLTLAHLQRSQEQVDKKIREDFAKYHDFRVARSLDPGLDSIVLWASGRITQSTLTERSMGNGKPFLLTDSEKVLTSRFFPQDNDNRIGEYISYATTP